MGGTKKTVLDFRLADMPARQGMSAFGVRADIARTEEPRPFGPGIDSGFVDAKHIQLAVAKLAAHSSAVIDSSLIA